MPTSLTRVTVNMPPILAAEIIAAAGELGVTTSGHVCSLLFGARAGKPRKASASNPDATESTGSGTKGRGSDTDDPL